MQEMIKKNHEKANREYVENMKKNFKKQKRQEKLDKVLGYFVGAFIIVIAVMFISVVSKQQQGFIESCTEQGYSVNYCMNHM